MDVVCLFGGQFAELMVFAVQYLEKMKWHHLMFVLSLCQWCSVLSYWFSSIRSNMKHPQVNIRTWFCCKAFPSARLRSMSAHFPLPVIRLDTTWMFDLDQSSCQSCSLLPLNRGCRETVIGGWHRAVGQVFLNITITALATGSLFIAFWSLSFHIL